MEVGGSNENETASDGKDVAEPSPLGQSYAFVSNVELADLISFDNANRRMNNKELSKITTDDSEEEEEEGEDVEEEDEEDDDEDDEDENEGKDSGDGSSCEDSSETHEYQLMKEEEPYSSEESSTQANQYGDNGVVPSASLFDSRLVNVSRNNKHAHGDQLIPIPTTKIPQRRRSPRKSKTVTLELGQGAEGGKEENINVSPSLRRKSPGKPTMLLVTSLVRPKDADLCNGTGDGQETSWRLKKGPSGSGRRQWYNHTEISSLGRSGSPETHRHRRPNRLYFFSDDEGEPAVDVRKLFSPRKHSVVTPHDRVDEETTWADPPKLRTSRKSRYPSRDRADTIFKVMDRVSKSHYESHCLNENVNNETRTSSDSTGGTPKKQEKQEKGGKEKKKKKKQAKESPEEESPAEEEAVKQKRRSSEIRVSTTNFVKSNANLVESEEPNLGRKLSDENKVQDEKIANSESNHDQPGAGKSGKKKKDKHADDKDKPKEDKDPHKEGNSDSDHTKKKSKKEKEGDKERDNGHEGDQDNSESAEKKKSDKTKQEKDENELGVIVYQIEVRFIVFKSLRFCGGVRVLMNCQEEKAYLQLITLMNEVFATYDIDNICFLEPRSAAGVSFCAVPYRNDNEKKEEDEGHSNLNEKEKEKRKRCKEKQKSRMPLIEHAEVVFCTPEQMVRFKTVVDTLLCAISCVDTAKPPRHLTDMLCDGAGIQDEIPEDQQEFLATCFEDPPKEDLCCEPCTRQYDQDMYEPMEEESAEEMQMYQSHPSKHKKRSMPQGQGYQSMYPNRQSQFSNRQSNPYQSNKQSQFLNNRQSQYQNMSHQSQQSYSNYQPRPQQSQYSTRPSQSQVTYSTRPSQSQYGQQGEHQPQQPPKKQTQFCCGEASPEQQVAEVSGSPAPTGPKKITTMQCFDPCPKDPATNSMACLPCDLGDPYQLNNNGGRAVFCTPACLKIASRTGEKIVYKGKLKIVQGCGGIGFIVRIESLDGSTQYCHSLRRDLSLYSTQEVPFGFGYSTVVCTSGRTTMESFVVAFPSAYQRDQFQHAVNTCKDILGMTSVQSLTHVKTGQL